MVAPTKELSDEALTRAEGFLRLSVAKWFDSRGRRAKRAGEGTRKMTMRQAFLQKA